MNTVVATLPELEDRQIPESKNTYVKEIIFQMETTKPKKRKIVIKTIFVPKLNTKQPIQ